MKKRKAARRRLAETKSSKDKTEREKLRSDAGVAKELNERRGSYRLREYRPGLLNQLRNDRAFMVEYLTQAHASGDIAVLRLAVLDVIDAWKPSKPPTTLPGINRAINETLEPVLAALKLARQLTQQRSRLIGQIAGGDNPKKVGAPAGMPPEVGVVLSQDEDGIWVAECQSIPGCVSQGKTEQAALKNVRKAIALCLEVHGGAQGTKTRITAKHKLGPGQSAVRRMSVLKRVAKLGTTTQDLSAMTTEQLEQMAYELESGEPG